MGSAREGSFTGVTGGGAVQVQVELEQFFVLDGLAARVLEAEAVEEADDRVALKTCVQHDFEKTVVLDVRDDDFNEFFADGGILPRKIKPATECIELARPETSIFTFRWQLTKKFGPSI